MAFTREELKAGPVRFRAPAEVRFQDVDAAGIVFFARLFEYFHDGYAAFLASRGVPLATLLARRTWVLPLKHAEADFLRPLKLGDRFEVQLVEARLGAKEIALGWKLAGADGTTVHAVGHTVHACVDVASFRGIELPADARDVFAPLVA